VSSADTTGTSESVSDAHTESTSHAPMLIPILGQEALPPQFRPLNEQKFRFTQWIAGLPNRHCFVRLLGCAAPGAIVTHNVDEPRTTRRYVGIWTARALKQLPFVIEMQQALEQVAARERAFETKALGHAQAERVEAAEIKRRIR
jgi:hypothetical protein